MLIILKQNLTNEKVQTIFGKNLVWAFFGGHQKLLFLVYDIC
jgi:hypothetical protein